ncbi:hypothetical protein [Chitinilyticum litopenaei]|uniref:hypothetical protein n=1 Tax=Chitinilyticum litopenaei TaxID=1121276 RepID=UPI00041D4165|nr:hypothetical protein [Chitinilyticum litopenaei]
MSCPGEFDELEALARAGRLLSHAHVERAVVELESIAEETRARLAAEPSEALTDRLSVLSGLIRFLQTQNPALGGVPA